MVFMLVTRIITRYIQLRNRDNTDRDNMSICLGMCVLTDCVVIHLSFNSWNVKGGGSTPGLDREFPCSHFATGLATIFCLCYLFITIITDCPY